MVHLDLVLWFQGSPAVCCYWPESGVVKVLFQHIWGKFVHRTPPLSIQIPAHGEKAFWSSKLKNDSWDARPRRHQGGVVQRSVTSVVFVTSFIYNSPYVFTLVQEICQNLPHLFNIDLVCSSFIPTPLNLENRKLNIVRWPKNKEVT